MPRRLERNRAACNRQNDNQRLVPLARLELARISPTDFESVASTIPPQGHCRVTAA